MIISYGKAIVSAHMGRCPGATLGNAAGFVFRGPSTKLIKRRDVQSGEAGDAVPPLTFVPKKTPVMWWQKIIFAAYKHLLKTVGRHWKPLPPDSNRLSAAQGGGRIRVQPSGNTARRIPSYWGSRQQCLSLVCLCPGSPAAPYPVRAPQGRESREEQGPQRTNSNWLEL